MIPAAWLDLLIWIRLILLFRLHTHTHLQSNTFNHIHPAPPSVNHVKMKRYSSMTDVIMSTFPRPALFLFPWLAFPDAPPLPPFVSFIPRLNVHVLWVWYNMHYVRWICEPGILPCYSASDTGAFVGIFLWFILSNSEMCRTWICVCKTHAASQWLPHPCSLSVLKNESPSPLLSLHNDRA